ncbi:MAG TPA: DUF3291 domain-containing protein [Candidatus Thermoplasmatota archaeon]|nr:DUF3291 domain-containing protein [Candidatus Thermoplasmatota archaeon]
MAHHLAQFNIARAIAPLDDPRLADFIARLDEINKLAEASPGFVWRFTAPGGQSSTYVQASDDPRMLVNLSVWASVEALRDFAYRSSHAELLRARRRWFEPAQGPTLAMWWLPAGALPTLDESKARLAVLAERGPTPDAFTFRQSFPAPSG